VGVNPLHALLADETSPYSPSSRTALNVLYLDVEAIDDFRECDAALAHVRSPSWQARLDRLRAEPLVDYAEVASLKFELFKMLYAHFRERHLHAETARARSFREFQSGAGAPLRAQALFDALREQFGARVAGATCGPDDGCAEHRDPGSATVAAFRQSHQARVEFFEYLQWQTDLQLAGVERRARDAGMAIGLYRDLAVGVNACGAEAWHAQHLFARGMHIGAPPDEFNQKGQDWGLPPWIPQRLTADDYAAWSAVLRANMHRAGALRIDHVMGLMRLFWIPAEGEPGDGAYVHYPFEALLGVLARESLGARCMVVGEDLGTVPDRVRAAMARLGILSYRVLYFERDRRGRFRAPSAYPIDALVTLSTHDLPTLRGFLTEADLRARDALDLFPDTQTRRQQYAARARDRERLLAALHGAGLETPRVADAADADAPFDHALASSVHAFLARTPSRLMTFQLEDVFGVLEQINLPSTTAERYPNWRRKLPLDLEDWAADGRFAAICAAIRAQGRGRVRSKYAAGTHGTMV
jgi:4-alpha-glucanotransferase